MFEDSLVESRVGQMPARQRWTALASVGLQFGVVALVIALPLMHPEAMPFHVDMPKVLLPVPPRPPVRVERAAAAASSAESVSPAVSLVRQVTAASLLFGKNTSENDAPAAIMTGVVGMGAGLPDGVGVGVGAGPAVSVAPARTAARPVPVSSGVSQGMLLAPIVPVYPAIARAAHVEGTVVVEAVISRAGTIESLRVVSGPAMLQSAALEAIRGARYRPFLLNGEATEVQTRITVNFRMGG
ncbi:energy transducer TonB [Granulicella sp. L60]|uniref:energy transducer TonB n=1 Tax=Granulicella sp. L60 TaxID=1641866 RepID=UPI00131D9E2A|nr:energy transducer TonB [Granulicella sp. L60]